MKPARVLLVGGGSLGHVAPAVAVAQALRAQQADIALHMLCTERPGESAFITKEGIPCSTLPLPQRTWSLPSRWHRARRIARELLSSFQPHCVFSKGGAVSVPVAWEAHRQGIPLILHESDVSPGWANRIMARWAEVVCCGFPQTHIRAQQLIHTGNPVRREMTRGDRTEGMRITGFSGERPVLLVIGGSQGAQSLNRMLVALLPQLLPHCDVAHITGEGKTAAPPQPGYWSAPLLHETYPHLFAITTLAISRSGAGSISELGVNGIPSILVPLEGVARDHQRINAEAVAAEDGGIVLPQRWFLTQCVPLVQELLRDREHRRLMAENLRRLNDGSAADSIARIVLSAATKNV